MFYKIISYTIIFFQIIVIYKFFHKISCSEKKISSEDLLTLIFFSIILYFTFDETESYIKIFTTLITYFLINYKILKNSFYLSISNSIFLFNLIAIVDIFYIVIVMLFNLDNIVNIEYLTVFYGFIIILILYILPKQRYTKNVIINFSKLMAKIIVNKYIVMFQYITYIVIPLAVFPSFYITGYNKIEIVNLFLVILCTSLTLAAEYKITEQDILKEKLLKLNETYINRLEDERVFKHNIKSKLLAIKSTGNDTTKRLVDEILNLKSIKIIEETYMKIPGSVINIFLDRLMSLKHVEIKIENTLEKDLIQTLNIKKFFEVSQSLGIIIDNAVEAITDKNENFIYIKFIEDKENIIITIINSFDSSLEIDEIGSKDYSTKERDSGIGLFCINDRFNINNKIVVKEDTFSITMTIKKQLK